MCSLFLISGKHRNDPDKFDVYFRRMLDWNMNGDCKPQNNENKTKILNYWNDFESPTDHNFVTSLKRHTLNTIRRIFNQLMSYMRLILARRRILCQTVSHWLVYPYFEGLCMRDFCVFTVLPRNCWARRTIRKRFIQSKAVYCTKSTWICSSRLGKISSCSLF